MAEFYGINPYQLSDDAFLAFVGSMPRLEAKRIRQSIQYRSDVVLSADQVYDLVLAETGDARLAGEAWRNHRHAELRSGRTPE